LSALRQEPNGRRPGGRFDVNEIFVSWSTPDKATVDSLIDRLVDVGLSVNEYSRQIRVGEEIRPWVIEAMDQARIVIVCLSAASADSEWIKFEAALAAERFEQKRLHRLVVVRIGEITTLPGKLQADRIVFFDTSTPPTEDELSRLVRQLHEALGQQAPLVVPTALYAMTSEEFDSLVNLSHASDVKRRSRLADLCHRVGMPAEPELWNELRGRYGTTSEEFSPFWHGRPLKDMLQHDVLRNVNSRRGTDGRQPLYLRWFSREDLENGDNRDQWREGHSLLLVDSISVLNSGLATELLQLPPPLQPRRAAVVWLPPYTRHTAPLEEQIETMLTGAVLRDTVRDWRKRDELPDLAFDIPSETSLRRWLGRVLSTVDDSRVPIPERVAAMTGGGRPRSVPSFRNAPGS
jgi:hypothetical protein